MALSTPTDNSGLAKMFEAFSSMPVVFEVLREHGRQIAALRAEVAQKQTPAADTDGWLDASKAAKYLDMSPNTFDKYRYQTSPSIKGYKVGGKTLYKKLDLDSFVMLYEVKSSGLA